MSRQVELQIEALERDLEDPDLTDLQKDAICRELRELGRELADEERWRDEGHQRGWSWP